MGLLKKYPSYKFVLAFFDFSALALAFFISLKLRFWPTIDLLANPGYFIHPSYWPLLIYSVFSLLFFHYYSLYKKYIFITVIEQQVLIGKTLLTIFGLYMFVAFGLRLPKYLIDSRLTLLYSIIFAILLVSFFRIAIFRTLFLLFAKQELLRRRVLVVGAGKSGKLVAAGIVSDRKYGYNLVGFVDDNLKAGSRVFGLYTILGKSEEVPELVKIYNIHEIIICLSNTPQERLIKIAKICNATGKIVHVYSDHYDIVAQKVRVERFSDFPLIRLGNFYNEGINHLLKRAIDIFGSLVGIILLSPVYFAVALAVKLDSPGPVIFKQKRLGKNGKLFDFYKFRSMHIKNDDSVHREYLKELIRNGRHAQNGGKEGVYKLTDDPRITKVGAFIRKWSLDELPQFFNVLKGDMSLVGPRPSLAYEFEEYQEWHKHRVKILPGITGLWQISGRNSITFDDMVILDLYYMENMSPWFDLQIILKTLPVIFLGHTGF